MADEPRVLVTGRFWMGAGGARALSPVLVEMIDQAQHEIVIVAYRLTIAHRGLKKALVSSLARGCEVRIILDRSEVTNEKENTFFAGLMKDYSNLHIWDFHEKKGARLLKLHAKLVVVDRTIAVVGSANFSESGLMDNHEIALMVTGKTAQTLSLAADKLIKEAKGMGALSKRVLDA